MNIYIGHTDIPSNLPLVPFQREYCRDREGNGQSNPWDMWFHQPLKLTWGEIHSPATAIRFHLCAITFSLTSNTVFFKYSFGRSKTTRFNLIANMFLKEKKKNEQGLTFHPRLDVIFVWSREYCVVCDLNGKFDSSAPL